MSENNALHLMEKYQSDLYPFEPHQLAEPLSWSRYEQGHILQYSHLYVIYNFDNKLYKIGITTNIKNRFRQLCNSSGCNLHLLFDIWFECCYDEKPGLAESYLHKYFSDKRKNGEWFDLTPKDLVKIRKWADQTLELYYTPINKQA